MRRAADLALYRTVQGLEKQVCATCFGGLKKGVEDINLERNSIVHSGNFKEKKQARKVVSEARAIINALLEPYYDGFELEELP